MTSSVKRLCPACAVQRGMLITPDCLICHGAGLLTLGPAALAAAPARTVAVAITIALESAARVADRTIPLGHNRTAPVVKAMEILERAGVVHVTGTPSRKLATGAIPLVNPSASTIAQNLTGLPNTALDLKLSEAPPYRYTEYDRPNARGLPVLSAGGFASHFARLIDPAEAGGDTIKAVRERNREELRAGVLLAGVAEAMEIKQKRQKGRS